MNRRPLGHTGITIGEIGLGAWQLANPAWGLLDSNEAIGVIEQALDGGCDFFDTAPGYSSGRSEELLGKTLQGRRDRVALCTKFGHPADGDEDFSASAVRPALEASLRRLRTDHLDLYLLHNPPRQLIDGTDLSVCDELESLKAEGKLRAYGVSLDARDELELTLENTSCGVVEVLFNVFHQDVLAAFPKAHARGVGLVAKVPLDSGWLSGKYRQDSQFTGIRSRWSPEVIARRAALVEDFANLVPPGLSLSHAAIQYILAQPEISSVIPGAKSTAQARDNIAAGEAKLTADAVRAIRQLWEREILPDPLPW